MNCGNEMKMKKWSLQWMQFMQLHKEAWKKNSGLQWGLNPWPRNYRCDVLPTELWSHWLWEQVNNYCGLKSWIFFRLLKLRSLWQSFLHFHFISAVHLWFISYIINTEATYVGSKSFMSSYVPVKEMNVAK